MRPVRLSVTLQDTPAGKWQAYVTRDDAAQPYGFPVTSDEAMDAISFAAGTVMRELSEAVRDSTGSAA